MLNGLCKIAEKSGQVRLVMSYTGENKFTLGVSDGITTPMILTDTTMENLAEQLATKLTEYLQTAEKEAAERKLKEEKAKHEAEVRAAEAKLRQEEAAKKANEKQQLEKQKQEYNEAQLAFNF